MDSLKKFSQSHLLHLSEFRNLARILMTKDIFIVNGWYSSAKSLYRSRVGRHFYGTENVIWAGFWPIGNTEKTNFGQIMSNF